jgi:hypothetical protein
MSRLPARSNRLLDNLKGAIPRDDLKNYQLAVVRYHRAQGQVAVRDAGCFVERRYHGWGRLSDAMPTVTRPHSPVPAGKRPGPWRVTLLAGMPPQCPLRTTPFAQRSLISARSIRHAQKNAPREPRSSGRALAIRKYDHVSSCDRQSGVITAPANGPGSLRKNGGRPLGRTPRVYPFIGFLLLHRASGRGRIALLLR